MTAQTTHPTWSFYIGVGAGLQDIVPLRDIDIPEAAKPYLNKRGIYSLNIPVENDSPWSPNFYLGASYNFHPRWRVSLQGGNQNIMQENYHAMVFSADALVGYDFLPHPHHALYLEAGFGGYFTWNKMGYLWKGKDGDGNQIVIDGVPEEIYVDLGRNDTRNLSIPLKASYQYNVFGPYWVGAYVQGRVNFLHERFAPLTTASAGIELRYTLGHTKQKVEKREHRSIIPAIFTRQRVIHDTIYVPQVCERIVHDTVYVEVPHYVEVTPTAALEDDLEKWVYFEVAKYDLPPYEAELLMHYDFSQVKSVSITAYTCGLGTERANRVLAERRLDTVVRLLRQRGVTIESQQCINSADVTPRFRSVKIEITKQSGN